jgi:hypothetical protein
MRFFWLTVLVQEEEKCVVLQVGYTGAGGGKVCCPCVVLLVGCTGTGGGKVCGPAGWL